MLTRGHPATREERSLGLILYRIVVTSSAAVYMFSGISLRVPTISEGVFLAALFLISLLDIGLSHGDTADADTALLVAGIYLYGAPTVLLMCTVTRVLVFVLASGNRDSVSALLDTLTKRFVAVLTGALLLWPIQTVGFGPAVAPYFEVAMLGAVFALAQLAAAQVGRARDRRDSLLRLLVGNLALQGPLIAAAISVSVLLVVIIDDMGPWGIVLTLLLLLAMRQSFVLLLDIRSSYQSTIEALVGAMEAQRSDGRGTGERVAALARCAAAELGWFGKRVERVGYAALLSYYGLSLSGGSAGESEGVTRAPLAGVEFLRPVAPLMAPLECGVQRGMRTAALRSAHLAGLAVEEYSPGALTKQVQDLEVQLGSRWSRRAFRAVEQAKEKSRC